MKLADRHHFGQRVEPMERASLLYFKKPRTVFWEHLFFGSDSPLRSLFSGSSDNSALDLSKVFFNLEILDQKEWSGLSKKVETSEAPITLSHFASFGALLGYAYIFGIRDLHGQNIVRCDDHLQVVDAEVVLTDLLLPQETLLLPFKECKFDECGLSRLTSDPLSMADDQIRAILSGYIDTVEAVYRARTHLSDVLAAQPDDSAIRILLRNTREYSQYRLGQAMPADRPLIAEELSQLDRGDVPYFFKRLDSDDVFWISGQTDRGFEFSTVDRQTLPLAMSSDIARHAVSPKTLLSSTARIEERLVRGLMSLQRILQINSTFDFVWNKKRLELLPQGLEIEALGQKFTTRRST